MRAAEAVSKTVNDWARYQNLAGDLDNVESSPVSGPYDWRAYIQEETELAKKRAPAPKKVEKPVAPAPTVYYV